MSSVSVIICTWNRAGSLAVTLASLAAQRQSGFNEVEVIVVDNNSKDNTVAVVERLRAGWPLGTLRYQFEPRQGKQFALNSGIRAARGDVLAFTDDDIEFPEDWLGAIATAFRDTALEVAGGRTWLRWPGASAPPWYADTMAAVLGGVDLGEARLLPPPPGYAPAGANLVARRALFDRIGMFSETHFRHMDYEFGMRCAQQRAVLAYEPTLAVCAPVDAAMLSKRYFRRWAFKAGISHEGADAAHEPKLLRAPRWVYRQLLQDLLKWPKDLLLAAPNAAFGRELRIWRSAGTIASCWYAGLWPERYPQWVAHYSQKKKNLY
jgi:glycosyltransferase involved in cell wall biosynthesis